MSGSATIMWNVGAHVAVLSTFTMLVVASGSASGTPSQTTGETYTEECLVEGCIEEEVDESYDLYNEECLQEWCVGEEVRELGGGNYYGYKDYYWASWCNCLIGQDYGIVWNGTQFMSQMFSKRGQYRK